jgi:5-(carboxyamino)imidazole ribonucleotide mutase
MRFVPIIMGSKKDKETAQKISDELNKWEINNELRVASAHKYPEYLFKIMEEYEKEFSDIVYASVAGLSNGLSGTMTGHTIYPVIASPPYSEKYAGADIFSSINMPSKIPVAVITRPENAALYVVRIFAMKDEELHKQLQEYLKKIKEGIEADDREIRGKV